MEFASLPEEELDALIGDCITSDLSDILYHTYNGDIELLKKTLKNTDVSEYVRAAMLDVMGQLYLDGMLREEELREFLRQSVHDGRDYDYLYDAAGRMLCRCHFFDMLPEIRYMFAHGLLDEMSVGRYDAYVDAMFEYRENEKAFCKAEFDAADTLRHWAMFMEQPKNGGWDKKGSKKISHKTQRGWDKPAGKVKTERNDPCPCGSARALSGTEIHWQRRTGRGSICTLHSKNARRGWRRNRFSLLPNMMRSTASITAAGNGWIHCADFCRRIMMLRNKRRLPGLFLKREDSEK